MVPFKHFAFTVKNNLCTDVNRHYQDLFTTKKQLEQLRARVLLNSGFQVPTEEEQGFRIRRLGPNRIEIEEP